MDTRKVYVAPAIAAEDVLEQTSLACTDTWYYLDACQTKGGNWDGDGIPPGTCAVQPLADFDTCAVQYS